MVCLEDRRAQNHKQGLCPWLHKSQRWGVSLAARKDSGSVRPTWPFWV